MDSVVLIPVLEVKVVKQEVNVYIAKIDNVAIDMPCDFTLGDTKLTFRKFVSLKVIGYIDKFLSLAGVDINEFWSKELLKERGNWGGLEATRPSDSCFSPDFVEAYGLFHLVLSLNSQAKKSLFIRTGDKVIFAVEE